MSRSRREDILDAEVLLVVKRPDENVIKVLRLIFGAVFAVFLGGFAATTSAPWGFMLIFCAAMLGLYALVFFLAINTNPIILTEKGITQKMVQSLYWQELAGYKWWTLVKRNFRLFLRVSDAADLAVHANQGKGSFFFIHHSSKAEMEQIFQQKGLREIV